MTNLERVDQIIAEIKQSMITPNYKPQTSEQMRLRAEQLRSMSVQARLAGVEVHDG